MGSAPPSLVSLITLALAASSCAASQYHHEPHELSALASRSTDQLQNPRGIIPNSAYLSTCKKIETAISKDSEVSYALSLQYPFAIAHYASSSSQLPACVVEPANAQDVSAVLKAVAADKTPFAIQGGGHIMNQGFSSTEAVHISGSRLQGVTYDATTSTVRIGIGNIWDNVYQVLDPLGVNVVGGRVSGVGVAGFTLGGGGYSWKSNQYGLTVDTVQSYELVLPNGTIVPEVTGDSYPDLFFALKGGYNNYGVVTSFTLQTFPQGQVYGGLATYTQDQIPNLNKAVVQFSQANKDPKAQIIPTYNFVLGQIGVSLLLFYDGPTAPPGIFDSFVGPNAAVKTFTNDVKTRSFPDLVKSAPANVTAGGRGAFHTVPLKNISTAMIDAIVNQTNYYGTRAGLHSGTFISYDVEPFLLSYYQTSRGGAYPHDPTNPLLPLNLYYAWVSPTDDDYWRAALKESARVLTEQANADGQKNTDQDVLYPNYALGDTPLERLYGADNLARMKVIKRQIDPQGIMDLAGGFKVKV